MLLRPVHNPGNPLLDSNSLPHTITLTTLHSWPQPAALKLQHKQDRSRPTVERQPKHPAPPATVTGLLRQTHLCPPPIDGRYIYPCCCCAWPRYLTDHTNRVPSPTAVPTTLTKPTQATTGAAATAGMPCGIACRATDSITSRGDPCAVLSATAIAACYTAAAVRCSLRLLRDYGFGFCSSGKQDRMRPSSGTTP